MAARSAQSCRLARRGTELLSHVEAEWRLPSSLFDRVELEQFARNRRVVRIDLRRSGLSDRDVADCSLDACILDVTAVADRVGFEHFAIEASSSAGLVAIMFAARLGGKEFLFAELGQPVLSGFTEPTRIWEFLW
jgi:pimeloyl-ACP methyl ester carboxylesterase